MKMKSEQLSVILLLIAGFILRLVLTPFYTHYSDMGLWLYWGAEIYKIGFQNFFEIVSWTDYLPFYFYFLYALEFINQISNIDNNLLFKLPGIIADIATAGLIFLIAKKIDFKYPLVITGLYLFNPAVFSNSAMWGQVDGIGAFLMTSALYLFFMQRLILLGLIIAMAILFKPLYILAIPIFLVAQTKYNQMSSIKDLLNLKKYKKQLIILLSTILFAILLTAPFANNLVESPGLIVQRYQASLNQYPYASVNAFNFWAMLDKNFSSDKEIYLGLYLQEWGIMIFCLIFGIVLFSYLFLNKQNINKLLVLVCAITFISIFTFATKAHERHLMTFFPFITLLVTEGYFLAFILIISSLIYILNLYFGLEYLFQNGVFIFDDPTIQLLSAITVLISLSLTSYYLYISFKNEKIS